METTSFTYVSYIETTPERLWNALTKSEHTEKYFFGTAIESEWKIGASVNYLREGEIVDYGTITRLELNQMLSYTWTSTMDKTTNREEPTHVTFLIKQLGPVVRLTLKHDQLLPSDIVHNDDTYEGFNNGWPAIISNLKSYLETGKTLEPVHT
ncbi:SRPBCC family protein [Ornithinibacillus californiensis]|uniref:SRPBCC family protein n=1 Tax=Ornithinibacillus californiensis TaxID=161536 RepID=UPI00064DEAC3|nr:SRPBCC family protein [Ornithinibacillus californiensis]